MYSNFWLFSLRLFAVGCSSPIEELFILILNFNVDPNIVFSFDFRHRAHGLTHGGCCTAALVWVQPLIQQVLILVLRDYQVVVIVILEQG